MTEKNVKFLAVSTADLTLMASGTTIGSAADMTDGQLAIVNSANATVTTNQTGTAPYLVRVVQKVGCRFHANCSFRSRLVQAAFLF